MTKPEQNKKATFTGVLFTAIVTLALLWAANQWINRYNWPPKLTHRAMQRNELKTFKNLQRIIKAQEKYKQTDWDNDGKKVYAKFFPHLWISIDAQSNRIPVNLISKRLAFAMENTTAVNGYYYSDIRYRQLSEKQKIEKLDHEQSWAIVALPAKSAKNLLVFIADNTSRIFAKNVLDLPTAVPFNPIENEWTQIETILQLTDFQKTIDYSKKLK